MFVCVCVSMCVCVRVLANGKSVYQLKTESGRRDSGCLCARVSFRICHRGVMYLPVLFLMESNAHKSLQHKLTYN